MNNHLFEQIYIINLARRNDRRKLIEYKLQKINVINYKFFEAIDGYDKSFNNIYDLISTKKIFNSRGAFGLIMTYINLLEDAYRCGYEKILILEDDVSFHKEYLLLIEKFKNIIENDEYDIIWLGANQVNLSMIQEINLEKTSTYLPINGQTNYTYGTFSIVINKNTINRLLEIINYRNILQLKPIDILLNELIRKKIITGIVCVPYIFMPDVSDSDNMGPRNQLIFLKNRRYNIHDYDYLSINDYNIVRTCYIKYINSTNNNNNNNEKNIYTFIEKIENIKYENNNEHQNIHMSYINVCNFLTKMDDIMILLS